MQKQITVFEDTKWTNASLPTASWYDVYALHAGAYAFDVPAYGMADMEIAATLETEYRVDRLLHHQVANVKHPNRETVAHISRWSFSVEDGPTSFDNSRLAWIGEPGAPVPSEEAITALHSAIRQMEHEDYLRTAGLPYNERTDIAHRAEQKARRAELVAATIAAAS